MKSNISTVTFVGHCFLSLTVVAASLSSSCAPASSGGEDSVAGAAGAPSAVAGAPAGGRLIGSAAGGAAGSGIAGGGGAGNGNAGTGDIGLAGSGNAAGSASAGTAGTPSTAGGGSQGGAASGGSAGGGRVGPGGPSLCASLSGAALCDGFEDAAPGSNGSAWTATSATVDSTKFYRGTKSIHITGSNAFISETKTFTGSTKATNNNLWGRYFFLTDLAAGKADAGHVVFSRLTDGKLHFHFAGGSRGVLQAEIASGGDQYTNAREPAVKVPLYPTATDGWQCWEWHVTEDDSFNFYVNGAEVTDMAIVKGVATKSKAKFPLPIFQKLELGYQSFNGVAMAGWIDEVAVGPERIGCGF